MLNKILNVKGVKALKKNDLVAVNGSGGLNYWDCISTDGNRYVFSSYFYPGQVAFGVTIKSCSPVGETSPKKEGDRTMAG